MPHTHSYKAKVQANTITWTEGAPPELKDAKEHDVLIMMAEKEQSETSEEERRKKMKGALEQLAKLNPFRSIQDPVQWQREQREEWDRLWDKA